MAVLIFVGILLNTLLPCKRGDGQKGTIHNNARIGGGHSYLVSCTFPQECQNLLMLCSGFISTSLRSFILFISVFQKFILDAKAENICKLLKIRGNMRRRRVKINNYR